MAIDNEPKDGDFARYIETLNNRSPSSTSTPPNIQTPSSASGNLSDIHWGKGPSAQSYRTDTPSIQNPDAPASRATLASQAQQGKLGKLLGTAAFLVGFAAFRLLLGAINEGSFHLDDIIPIAFLGFFASVLFKGSRRLRTASRQALSELPPLTTRPHDKP